MGMHHFTDRAGYNGIRATVDWRFKAAQPPREHPFGAYFTTLTPSTRNLALRLRIPKSKTEYVFIFVERDDLIPLRGQRGDYIFYSPSDYLVEKSRQLALGESANPEPVPGDRRPQS